MSGARVLTLGVLGLALLSGEGTRCARAQNRGQNSPSARARARDSAPPARPASTDRATKPPTTLVTLELLTKSQSSSLKSYEWAKVAESLNIACTVRRGREDDEPGVTEKSRGGALRQIVVVGRIDERGRLVFPDRAFAPGDGKRLGEWLEELKTYGAQGAPEGQRVWGLSPEQFGALFESLMTPVEFETLDQELGAVLDQLKFSPRFPLKLTAGAQELLGARGRKAACSQSLRGFSLGTTLSLLLGEQGLGFKPRRNPDGSIDLAVYTLEEAKNVWPVGWYRNLAPAEAAPTLFVFKEIHFDDVDVESALSAGAEVTGVPVLIDRPNLKGKEIDLTEKSVDFPLKRTTWAQAYDRILGKTGCKYELLIDEAGHPFVWITTQQTPSRKP